jgi:putative addiction module component (TIGR02574 family)
MEGCAVAIPTNLRYTLKYNTGMEASMSNILTEIEEKVRALTPEDRLKLIRNLIADLDGPPDSDVESAWAAEAKRRHQEIIEGKVQTIPGEHVFEHLRSRLKR